MGQACIAFGMEDVRTALNHMELELVIDYGEYAYGH